MSYREIKGNSGSFFIGKKITYLIVVTAILILCTLQSSWVQGSLRRSPVVVAVEKVSPAVVNISTVVHGKVGPLFPLLNNDFFKDFFHGFGQREYTRTSLGSGVIIDGKKGYIITNHHVVAQASEVKVITSKNEEFQAKIVGSDPRSDLAVLQVETQKVLPEIKMGESDDLMIGETVIAIGNPFGLSHSVTTGVISAVDRSVRAGDHIFRKFIQTDASINPGNSGGPLLNIDGELIGINTAIYQKAQGIGFAIPIDKAKSVVRELIKEGVVYYPWLGLEVQELTSNLKSIFGLDEEQNGVLVSDLIRGGPADGTGLKRGDIIQMIEDFPVSSTSEYQEALSEFIPGDEIKLKILRKNKEINISVKAAAFPLDLTLEIVEQRIGIFVGKSDRKTLNQYGLKDGVSIQKVRKGSEAQRIGLEPGDIILKVNDVPIDSLDAFKKAIRRYHYLPSISMIVGRGPYSYSLTFPF